MSIQFHISWSIYVRCVGKPKFMRTHLPAIENLIGTPEMGWVIFQESYNPGEVRAVTNVNHEAPSKDEAVILSLKQASLLYGGFWNVTGLSTLTTDQPLYLYGVMNTDNPTHTAPALTTAQIEVEEGHMSRSKGGL